MSNFTETPAVGTRVTLRKVFGDLWGASHNGKSGAVVRRYDHTGESVVVRFDDGSGDYGRWTSLEPEATPAVAATPEPAPEITLNGHRYVLAPEQEPEKVEEKRVVEEIKPGQWVTVGKNRRNGDRSFIRDVHRVIGVNETHVVIDWRFLAKDGQVSPKALLRSEYDVASIELQAP